MSAIVIVIPDLYCAGDTLSAEAAWARIDAVPGIEYLARFGEHASRAHGWRDRLAVALGQPQLAPVAPALLAAAALQTSAARAADSAGTAAASAWIATPVHLRAGPTRLHLDHAGLLRLAREEQQRLVQDFQAGFAGSGIVLAALPCGEFLLTCADIPALTTLEPARCAGADIAPALTGGREAGVLRRLNTEIEMWLHDQPVNRQRVSRGQPPVNALWLWGATPPGTVPGSVAAAGAPGGTAAVFGRDAVADGLAALLDLPVREVPDHLADMQPQAAGTAVALVSLAGQLQSPGHADGADSAAAALARIDAHFVSPAVAALRQRAAASVTLMCNDRAVMLRRTGPLRFWRRRRSGLSGFT